MSPTEIRNFNPDKDFPAYVELLNTAANYDEGNLTTEEEQRQFADIYSLNLASDRFVVENPENTNELIAVCDIWQINGNPSTELSLLVHPDWRRKGLGSTLFQHGVTYAKSLSATAIDAYAEPTQRTIQAFLMHQKFTVAGNFTGMYLNLQNAFPKVVLPDGYTVRTYAELEGTELDKINLILKAGREFWGDLWGHKVEPDNEVSRQGIREQILDDFSEDSMFFLYDKENNYIGHDRVHFNEGADGVNDTDTDTQTDDNTGIKIGDVGVPALHPDYRTPELSVQFALVGLNQLFEQGCREFVFSSWGESDATIQAFEALGFKTTFFELGYQLKLT